jgi:5-methylthioadenosine/S-adenosylhomocysteine deaminase
VREQHFPAGTSGRLRMGLALRGPAMSSREATRHDFELARELDLPISIHVGMAGYPGAVRTLDELGLLGADINYAHANELSDDEYERIAATGGSISICPSIDMLMALGTHPATGRARAHGIDAGLSGHGHGHRQRPLLGDAARARGGAFARERRRHRAR